MATSVAVQRAEERQVTITPVENLMDRVNKMSQAITQRAFEIFEGNGRTIGHDLEDWFKAEMDMLHPVHVKVVEAKIASRSGLRCLVSARRRSKSASNRAV